MNTKTISIHAPILYQKFLHFLESGLNPREGSINKTKIPKNNQRDKSTVFIKFSFNLFTAEQEILN